MTIHRHREGAFSPLRQLLQPLPFPSRSRVSPIRHTRSETAPIPTVGSPPLSLRWSGRGKQRRDPNASAPAWSAAGHAGVHARAPEKQRRYPTRRAARSRTARAIPARHPAFSVPPGVLPGSFYGVAPERLVKSGGALPDPMLLPSPTSSARRRPATGSFLLIRWHIRLALLLPYVRRWRAHPTRAGHVWRRPTQ